MGVEITPLIANCLYTGLATDTGCFRFSSTTANTHLVAAKLILAGAQVEELSDVKEKLESSNDLRVATKYPNIAKEYFYQKKHQTIEIVKLHGSVELAPIVGLADVIVDIVETGSTLKANGLEVLADVCPISARMVVNRVSMKLEHERIANIINGLRKMVGENK